MNKLEAFEIGDVVTLRSSVGSPNFSMSVYDVQPAEEKPDFVVYVEWLDVNGHVQDHVFFSKQLKKA